MSHRSTRRRRSCHIHSNMWKLFPNTWLERAGVFKHRHAQAAEALERHWLEWLAEGLRRVNPRTLDSQDSDPAKALRKLSGPGLLCLDEKLRTGSVHHSHRPNSSSPPLAEDNGDELFADAYLFVAACSPSGFIREPALVAFAHYPGPLASAIDSNTLHSPSASPARATAGSRLESLQPRRKMRKHPL
jgi:hypothetical protein